MATHLRSAHDMHVSAKSSQIWIDENHDCDTKRVPGCSCLSKSRFLGKSLCRFGCYFRNWFCRRRFFFGPDRWYPRKGGAKTSHEVRRRKDIRAKTAKTANATEKGAGSHALAYHPPVVVQRLVYEAACGLLTNGP